MRRIVLVLIVVGAAACGPKVQPGDDDDCTTCDAAPEPVCTPGVTEPCYHGAPGTENVGTCVGGIVTCDADGFWGICEGEVTPHADICLNGLNEDCDATVDEEADNDGDGYTNCTGDCCDDQTMGCLSPELVNPGAFEAAGNTVDDDCDGTADNTLATCDSGISSNSSDPMDAARAIDLCQTATEDPGDTRWGVISASYVRADSSGAPVAAQHAIRTAYGATPLQGGDAMLMLSTGVAAGSGQTNPNYVAPQIGTSHNTTSGFPADWLAANGGNLPNSPGCPDPADGTAANDPIMLELRVRAPTNAKSFQLDTNFISSEYPEWVCGPYNDFFVVLLDSVWDGSPANPADKNLANYTDSGGTVHPVGVNLAHGDTGLFTQCTNGATGCGMNCVSSTNNTCVNMTELAGTGMEVNATAIGGGISVACGSNKKVGGGTSWLTTAGNVEGGEIIKLRIAVWDTTDTAFDSHALIDNFRWSVDASDPGTVIDID